MATKPPTSDSISLFQDYFHIHSFTAYRSSTTRRTISILPGKKYIYTPLDHRSSSVFCGLRFLFPNCLPKFTQHVATSYVVCPRSSYVEIHLRGILLIWNFWEFHLLRAVSTSNVALCHMLHTSAYQTSHAPAHRSCFLHQPEWR